MSIDNQTLKMLIRIKLMFYHALEHSNKKTEIDALISFLGLDNVVENLLNVIVSFFELDSKIKSNKDYSDLADYASQISSILKSEYNLKLPYLSDIKLLRKTRNLIQHSLANPGMEIDRFVKIVRRFFDYSIIEIFKLSENDINDFLLIENELVKHFLQKSKNDFENGRYLESIVATRDAFENTWFEIIKASEINLSSLAADIEAKKNNMFYAEYFSRIKKEIILIKLGIDSKNYEKFENYLRHIPSDYCADRGSIYSVMQRDWNVEDASFCYEFAFDFIMKYQNSLNQPLYKIDFTPKYTSEDKYGNINISEGSESLMSFVNSDKFQSHEMQLLYANELLKQEFDKLVLGKTYLFEKKGFFDNKIDFLIKYKTILHNVTSELVTNNPPKWQIMIWFEYVPFSWHKYEYLGGEIIKQSININKVNLEDFAKEFNWLILKDKASKIINYRETIGRISSGNDLKKVKGLTKKEIYWISRFTHL